MNYKVGDLVQCNVETINNKKRICKSEKTNESVIVDSFQVLYVDQTMQTYMILLKDDMVGGIISNYHTSHLSISKTFLFKKFTDIAEIFILGKK